MIEKCYKKCYNNIDAKNCFYKEEIMLFIEKLKKNGYIVKYNHDKAKIYKNGRKQLTITWERKKIIIKSQKFTIHCKSGILDVRNGLTPHIVVISLKNAKILYKGTWYKWNEKLFIPDLWIPMSWLLKEKKHN